MSNSSPYICSHKHNNDITLCLQGFRVYPARNLWYKSLVPLAEKIRAVMGDSPVYVSFDIDGLDPCYAPGTGTPEIGGLSAAQALELVRGCRGMNIVGADLVEVRCSWLYGNYYGLFVPGPI